MKAPSMMAFPPENGTAGFVAIGIPAEMVKAMPPAASALLVRIKSADAFRDFMLGAIEAAAQVWPEIAQEWID